jgi:crotonobetainyl-CoA:carnitine CoA-transferase CaiB-like acyl-CoA transferase
MKSLPLDGLLVVSIEQAVAAPFATRQLADLGARIIKVERPEGDFARNYDSTVHGEASYFVWLNRSKESLVLDLKDQDDLSGLKNIIKKADVFVQNLAPGAIERLGLGAEELRATNPKLIHVSISGYGRGGIYENKKAYDLLIQCESGLLSVTGSPDEVAKVGISVADIASGMYAFTGVLSALLNRAKTGQGDTIEVSMLEALGEWMQQPELYARYGGTQQPRSGASHAMIRPYGPFKTLEGTVFLGIQNEREWARFCELVLENGRMADDPLFASNSLRVENGEVLNELIQKKIAKLSTQEAIDRLESAGVANAELRDLSGLAHHPQLMSRNRWIEFETPAGKVSAQRPPVTSENMDLALGPVPAVGAHTESIKREFGIN